MTNTIKNIHQRQPRVPINTVNSLINDHNQRGRIVYGRPESEQYRRLDGTLAPATRTPTNSFYRPLRISNVFITYIVEQEDEIIHVDDDIAGGDVSILLPDATANAGRGVRIKKLGTTYDVTILPSPAEPAQTIDGETSILITSQYTSLYIISNGINWFIH